MESSLIPLKSIPKKYTWPKLWLKRIMNSSYPKLFGPNKPSTARNIIHNSGASATCRFSASVFSLKIFGGHGAPQSRFEETKAESNQFRIAQTVNISNLQITSIFIVKQWQSLSADPSRRVVAIILCKIQIVPKIQNPRSKIQTAAFGAATKKMDTTTIQNPRSKTKGFGFGRLGWGRRRWLCSKCCCMGGLATRIWPSWWRPKLVSRRSEARSPTRAFQIGHRFPGEDFAGNWAPVSSPVSWKSGLNFQRNYHEKWWEIWLT